MRCCLLMVLVCLAWSGDGVPTAFRGHVVSEAGIIVAAPADWIPQAFQSGVALVLRSPATAGPPDPRAVAERERRRVAVSVVTSRLAAGDTLAAFAARCRADLERIGTNVRIDESRVVDGPLPMQVLRYRIDLGPYTFVHALLVEGTGVCVTAGCGIEAWPQWQADVAAIGAGLRRTGARPASSP